MIAVVDSGVANLASVMAALRRLNAEAVVTADATTLANADRVIMPGVGSANAGMKRLKRAALDETLRGLTRPMLGICLGMQLLYTRSEENGGTDGVGVLEGDVRRLQPSAGITVPHMGWNTLEIGKPHPLLQGIENGSFVYFVHSYAAQVNESTLASCRHGVPFSAVVAKRNFFGCQFHPERSGAVGARILQNFLSL
jgi:glutamine amidotransferase